MILPKWQEWAWIADAEKAQVFTIAPKICHPLGHETCGALPETGLIKSLKGCRRLAHMAVLFPNVST
eukprot:CAMPEP_0184463844 /NCGR_PEP_ID=MMETSP0740-20130409/54510_1 /TAXON_ID=385413 /ORGANISM="Thalassiosira miniscula, Strain CCMP1093" /LENGTH=66 /DNA_ID=CAMNT_0026838215 /DNA_START=597 /DNA_END=793 /DNA_ORIENTATION=+